MKIHKNYFIVLLGIFLGAIFLFVYVFTITRYNYLSKEYDKKKKELETYQMEQKALLIEIEGWVARERIEKIAVNELGMVYNSNPPVLLNISEENQKLLNDK